MNTNVNLCLRPYTYINAEFLGSKHRTYAEFPSQFFRVIAFSESQMLWQCAIRVQAQSSKSDCEALNY